MGRAGFLAALTLSLSASAASADESDVLVRLSADDVVLQQRRIVVRADGEESSWIEACAAPCDRRLPLGGEYRVDGAWIMPSKPFSLREQALGNKVGITVDRSSSVAFGAGIGMIVIGGAAFVAGAGFAIYGNMLNQTPCPYDCAMSGFQVGGLISLGVGLVLTIIGVVMVHDTARSHLAFSARF